jgi:hypothetical protein
MILSVISRRASAQANTRQALLVCFLCIVALSASRSASADFVGLTATHKADLPICQDTENEYIDVPLTVCNVFAGFDDPLDELSLVQSADIQVFDGPNPDVFFQHDIGNLRYPPCSLIELYPSLVCDSFVTIGLKCYEFNHQVAVFVDEFEFNNNGHLTGCWLNTLPSPFSLQGVAGTYPDNQVLIAQLSVAQGLSVSGTVDILWRHDGGDFNTTGSVAFVCEAEYVCGDCPTDMDGNGDTGASDLAVLLGSWGPCAPGDACECLDDNGDGVIGAADLAVLLGSWGPCP